MKKIRLAEFRDNLGKSLFLDEQELTDFESQLFQSNARIAGSFPLLYVCDFSDWNVETVNEIQAFVSVAQHMDFQVPQPFLQQLGDQLQSLEFKRDLAEKKMDVDVFISIDTLQSSADWETAKNAAPLGLSGWRRSYADEPGEFGAYAVMPHVEMVHVWRKGSIRLNVIWVQGAVDAFIWRYFDFAFCRAVYDGSRIYTLRGQTLQRQTQEPSNAPAAEDFLVRSWAPAVHGEPRVCEIQHVMPMRGNANLTKYSDIYAYLEKRATDAATDSIGLSGQAFQWLAYELGENMQERLAKYKRRRFTIENHDQFLQVIAQLMGL